MNEEINLLSLEKIKGLLTAQNRGRQEALYRSARRICAENCGSKVLLRGIVEFSSYCRNTCMYCGLRSQNTGAHRYRLTADEIVFAVEELVGLGVGTVVLQSGEDPELSPDWVATLIERIKKSCDIAVTLSLGEWPASFYRKWRSAGADRYLLKIESTDQDLYRALHPGMDYQNRLRCLEDLERLGYQTGSGIIVGLPGQSVESIAGDLKFLAHHDFDMISIGPFIPHPQTPLASYPAGSIEMTCKAIAITRSLTKNTHIPATSALAATRPDQRYRGLLAGANVIMPNFTPPSSARYYDIYPHAARTAPERPDPLLQAIDQIRRAGRETAYFARGDSLKRKKEYSHE